jgi:hypothetical protein
MSAFGSPPATVAPLCRGSTALPGIQVVTPHDVAAANASIHIRALRGF